MTHNKKFKVRVDLDSNTISIVTTETQSAFNNKGIFVIEGERGGFSRIERVNGSYMLRNYLRTIGMGSKLISEKEFNKQECKNYIKEIMIERRSDQ